MKKNIFAAIILAVSILFTFSSCSNAANGSANACTITLDANGGKVYPSSMTVFSGTPVSYLPKAVREGFEFSNWNTEKNGKGSIIQTGTIIESDITLYAQWGTKLVSVEYYPNYPDGSKGKKQSVSFASGNQILITDTPFSYKGYSFIGWNTKEDGSGDDWSPNTYYFDTENLKLYAQWEAEFGYIYKVHHYQQNTDGTYPEEPTTTTTNYGYADQIYSATRNNYTGFIMPEPKDVTVKADNSAYVDYYYERKTVTLTFDPNGGKFPLDYSVKADGTCQITGLYGSEFTIPFTSKDGYDYTWNPTLYSTYMPASNRTYTANWTLRTHTITYNLNKGSFESGFTPITSFTELESITLPGRNDIYRTGYSFAGWYEDEDCFGKRIYFWAQGRQKEDITLYAKWIEVSNTWSGMKYIDTTWYDPSQKKFVLRSPEEFAGLANLINSGTTFAGKTVEMDFDLILNEDHANYKQWGTKPPANIWTGIGYSGRSFRGILDGKGHNVYGMYMDSKTISTENCGFIGETIGATIKNLNIVDCYIKSTKKRTAGVVGYATDQTVIENCTVSGYISSSQGSVGGIVGISASNISKQNVIINCTNNAEILSSSTGTNQAWAGGIVSTVWDHCSIIGCVNNGNCTSYTRNCAGIVGEISDDANLNIINCTNNGTIKSTDRGAGGIAGGVFGNANTYYLSVLSCTNNGNVSSSQYGAGGIVGEAPLYTNIYNCVNSGNISAPKSSGGIVGYGNKYEIIYNCLNYGNISVTSTSTLFGGIEGNQRYSESKIYYSYNNINNSTQLIGTSNAGSITGCGSFDSYSDPVALIYDVTSGTQGTTYTTTYADNSTTTVLDALKAYTAVNSSMVLGASSYDVKPWAEDTNGRPYIQY